MSGQKIYRGNIRASLPVGGQASHKPYQTLEVSPEQGESQVISSQCSHHVLPDAAGLVTLLPGHVQHPLQLVDPGIQLHQQEWVSPSHHWIVDVLMMILILTCYLFGIRSTFRHWPCWKCHCNKLEVTKRLQSAAVSTEVVTLQVVPRQHQQSGGRGRPEAAPPRLIPGEELRVSPEGLLSLPQVSLLPSVQISQIFPFLVL